MTVGSSSFGTVKAWFVSDIHISSPEDPRLSRFENFLRARLDDQTTDIFLVGDIFDLWVGGDDFFVRRYESIVSTVRELRSRGVRVVYFEGNHDLHLQRVWSKQLGCDVEGGPRYYDLGRFRVRVEHGDQMNPDDTGYLLLRKILRTGAVEQLADKLPGAWIQAIGNSMSRSSRKWTSSSMKARNETEIRNMIRRHAREVYAAEPFDLLISGHVHVQDDTSWKDEESGAEVRSINLGWWAPSEPAKALLLDENGPSWVLV